MIIDGNYIETTNCAEARLVNEHDDFLNVHINNQHRFEAKDLVELAYFLARKAKNMDPDVDTDYYFGEQFRDARYVYGYSVDGVFEKPLEMVRGLAYSVDEAAMEILTFADPMHPNARWFIRDVLRDLTVAVGSLNIDETISLKVDRDYSVDLVA